MKNFKLSKEGLLLFFMIFFALKIGCISYVSSALNLLWYIGAILVCFYAVANILYNHRFNKFDFTIFLFYMFLLFTTTLNKGDLLGYVKELVSFMTTYYVIKYGLEKNATKFINIFSTYLLLLLIINTFSSIIFYPNAMFRDNNNPIFFMGGDNTSVRLYIISILFCFMNKYITLKKMTVPTVPLLNLLTFSIVRDLGGGKVCFIILLLCILYLIYGANIPIKTIKKIIVVNVVLFFLLVIVNKIGLFKFIIVDVLHRNLSLTDRTVIWDITIKKIINSPIIGYGMINGLSFQAMLPYITGINAHNTYLMILFNGGIILFIIFVISMLIGQAKFDSIKHDRWIYMIPFTLLTLMIRAQIEGWDVIWLFILLFLCYSYDKIEQLGRKEIDKIK